MVKPVRVCIRQVYNHPLQTDRYTGLIIIIITDFKFVSCVCEREGEEVWGAHQRVVQGRHSVQLNKLNCVQWKMNVLDFLVFRTCPPACNLCEYYCLRLLHFSYIQSVCTELISVDSNASSQRISPSFATIQYNTTCTKYNLYNNTTCTKLSLCREICFLARHLHKNIQYS